MATVGLTEKVTLSREQEEVRRRADVRGEGSPGGRGRLGEALRQTHA